MYFVGFDINSETIKIINELRNWLDMKLGNQGQTYVLGLALDYTKRSKGKYFNKKNCYFILSHFIHLYLKWIK